MRFGVWLPGFQFSSVGSWVSSYNHVSTLFTSVRVTSIDLYILFRPRSPAVPVDLGFGTGNIE
jgi:hypothetical protein